MVIIQRSRSDCQPEEEDVVYAESSLPRLEDIITEDGIFSTILSSLSLVEAVRISVVSPRWRQLWPLRTKFHFDAANLLDCPLLRDCLPSGKEAYELTKGMTARFIHSVNSILPQLQGVRIDEFSVRYFLDKTHSQHLDAWLQFAFSSQAKVLKFNLYQPNPKSLTEPYEFPCHLLGSSSESMKKLSISFCSFKLPSNFDGLHHLKVLTLAYIIDLTEEDFNHILSNCSSTLTELCLWTAPQLVSISIPQPLSQLHTLIVRQCDQLRKIEISTVNLVKLHYEGVPVDLKFKQSSKPNDARIHFINKGRVRNLNLDFYLNKISNSLLRLRCLSFKITGGSLVADLPKGSSKFLHLTHFNWEWKHRARLSLHNLATLLNVAPSLEEMKLSFLERVPEQPPQIPSMFRDMPPKHRHNNLKKIRLCGFCFDTWQIEIAVYLCSHALELESMVIERGRGPEIESITIERGSKLCTLIESKMIERGSNPSWFVSKETLEMGTMIIKQEIPANVELVVHDDY